MSGPREVPTALRRRGILRVTDNVPSGSTVRVPAGAFFSWFGEALLARVRDRADQDPTTETTTQGDDHAD